MRSPRLLKRLLASRSVSSTQFATRQKWGFSDLFIARHTTVVQVQEMLLLVPPLISLISECF